MMRRLAVAALTLLLAPTPALSEAPGEHHDLLLRYEPESGRLTVTDRVSLDSPDSLRFELASEIEWVTVTTASGTRALANPGEPLEVKLNGAPAEAILHYTLTLPELDLMKPWDLVTPGRSPEASVLPVHGSWLPRTPGPWSGYRIAIELPLPQRAVAIGALVEESERDGIYRAVYAADHPAEPPSVFIGSYVVGERRVGDLRLRTWFHSEAAGESEAYLAAAEAFIARYQAEIGPYPFAGFDMVSAPFGVGLGFPGLTYIGRRIVGHPYMRGRSLAHEILHNWWGNGVRVDYAGGNWCEGLTTYLADHALAAEDSLEAARRLRQGWLAEFTALDPAQATPVTRFTAKRHQASEVIGYGKVAFIFHMLHRELGEAAFLAGLRGFWQRHHFRTVGWPDLRDAFEHTSAQDLGWFFEQWLTRSGAPRLALEGATRSRQDGKWQITVTLRQDQPTYRLDVPLRFGFAEGPRDLTLAAEGPVTTATLTFDSEPLSLSVDPDHDLFRRLLPGEAAPILRDVTLAGRVRTVIDGGDPAFHRAAETIAVRLLERAPELAAAEAQLPDDLPLLVIAPTDELDRLAALLGIDADPPQPLADAPARAWAARRARGAPLVVVTANDTEALKSLGHRLPYYGGESYALFQSEAKADAGRWPVTDSPLAIAFGAGAR